MADLGKVAVTDGGNYSASTTYEKLTFVHYQGDAYMTLKTVKGVTPTDDGVNYKLFCKSAVLATASKAGIVMPDGTTTTVNSSGKMSAKQATQSTTGIVKGSNSIKVGSDGAIDVNTTFTQAVNLANIITGEAIATILGKVSKAIATTMNLNQNALLKSMLTSIDANDSSKIPTSAYIHTLVERIGMGTQLTAGANLTEAANNLSSNFDNLETALNSVLKTQWTSNSNEITVGPGSTVTAQFPTARIAGFVPIGIVGFSVKDGLTVYQCNTDTTNYTTNVYVRNDTASNIINTSGQISALVLYAKTFK